MRISNIDTRNSIESIVGYGSIENMKKFYNDRINWKLYNYILDCVTKYIDTGRLIFISIEIKTQTGQVQCDIYHTHYQSGELVTDVGFVTTDEAGWINDNSMIPMREIEFNYRLYGLTYRIGLLNKQEMDELINRVTKKFNVECKMDSVSYLDIRVN